MGAAFLAAIATGLWSPGSELRELRRSERVFGPEISDKERQRFYKGWIDSVNRIKTNA